ncbi:autotransporter assembly complex family protein [Neisseria mucosa]|uniref:Translocation and assembly module subunit TamA n=1 Tax=Neisseria mucosa TaxID=488 RepID=A0AAW6ZBG5_NEIMU|nr:autotransporter assembly complex family protein [Neisseria mucosa]MDK6725312.1 autotransporter assembly complex family protein [Neisseria mucosa]MDK6869745.1 autotransporter assembly complex family protein [Neisseria mucosa]MDK8109311.1 autotransporter assembly complex family protein [Neisseria mucosa]MDK8360900.1 autotransporter assembly complex family protein [Neisseria mucosa]
MTRLTSPILIASLALAYGHATAADLPRAEDYEPIPGFKQGGQSEQAAKAGKLTPKFPVKIETKNSEVKSMLEEYLPLITQQQDEELDKEQVGFLAEETPDNVKTMLKTKGYFNGSVNVQDNGSSYTVAVNPGPRTKIDNVSVAILGDILSDDNLAEYYQKAMLNWQQPVGEYFDQDGWSGSKTSVLSAVTRKKYPLAKLSSTQATVNPNNNTADLNVIVESNRPIYFGDFEITGTRRYPENVVAGLARFKPGAPYDLDLLLDFQQALEQNGHYSGASVQADFDRLQGDRVPVKVNVTEVKRHKLETGIRYDSEYGLGGRIGYDYYNLFNKGYIGSVVWDMDKYETTLAAGISQPRNSEGKYWTTNTSYNRSTTQNLEKRSLTSGIWRVRDRNGIESRLGIEFITEDRKVPDTNYDLGRSHATMLTASWKRQNIETELRPENGYYLDGKIGATLGNFLSSTAMARATARAGYFYTPENKKLGTFIVRGQAGYVYAREGEDVPSSLMFRTGGASSVRGYELDSIGLAGPNNSVLPDRALLVGSLEYQFPITKSISGAVFHDVGDAAGNFKRMSMKHGTGLGVRWFSPVAPFSFDVAYGHQDKKIRWHISLGTRF